MSSDTIPISPARFAEALKDLPLSSLHLKVLELRNSIAHLDYSNEQLRPFAEGREAIGGGGAGQPDQDCVEAIAENEAVITRMQDRIRLVRVEVEGRGVGWEEFQSKEEAEEEARQQQGLVNGHAEDNDNDEDRPGHTAWTDGTFQTGTIRNGEVHMDAQTRPPRTTGTAPAGTLTDEELRRRLEQQLGPLDGEGDEDEDGGGVHL